MENSINYYVGILMDINHLDNRLKILKWTKHGDLLEKVVSCGGRDCLNEFKKWTPLKLIVLSYFAGVYTSILRNQLKDIDLIYIDLFSGTGVNIIKESKEILVGSPLAFIDSVSNRNLTFDMMFFNDIDPKSTEALKKRLGYLEERDQFKWISGKYEISTLECNDAIDIITNKINNYRFKHFLAFIDPYKWQLQWSSFEKLLSIGYGDIIITFQSLLTAKEIGSLKSGHLKGKIKSLKSFLGEENEEVIINLGSTEGIGLEEGVRKYYINKIIKYKPFVMDIKISAGGKNPYKYYIIYATGKEDPKWVDVLSRLQKFIEEHSGDEVNISIDYLQGKQKRMDDYF